MYRSQKRISTDGLQQLKSDLALFLQKKKTIPCRSLKRHVSLVKLPDAIAKRHDAKRRLQSFIVALDIVRFASEYTERIIGKQTCYEIRGCDSDGRIVIVHLREEVVRKDRMLFFVSCSTTR